MVVLSVSDGIDLTAVHFPKKNIDVNVKCSPRSTLRVGCVGSIFKLAKFQ